MERPNMRRTGDARGGPSRRRPWERVSRVGDALRVVRRWWGRTRSTRAHAALAGALVVSASCQSVAALGRALERAAYPTGGAAIGAAVAGPGGAAGGAAAGHLLGESVLHDGGAGVRAPSAGEVVAEQVRVGFVDILLVPLLGVPFFVWALVALIVALRAPWLPGLAWDWIADRFERRRGPR